MAEYTIWEISEAHEWVYNGDWPERFLSNPDIDGELTRHIVLDAMARDCQSDINRAFRCGFTDAALDAVIQIRHNNAEAAR